MTRKAEILVMVPASMRGRVRRIINKFGYTLEAATGLPEALAKLANGPRMVISTFDREGLALLRAARRLSRQVEVMALEPEG